MSLLDDLVPTPRRLELDHVEVAVPPGHAWDVARHLDFGRFPLVRALFTVRTLPSRLVGERPEAPKLRIDDLAASDAPGFHVLGETPGREIVLGAIGKVWEPDIPFVDVRDPSAFRAFATPGYAKVAWALRVLPSGERDARIEVEVRVDTTDEDSWKRFRRYFRVIGPGSHFIRAHVLGALARELGTPASREAERALPGDDLLDDAAASVTHGITIDATPEAIWPWLVQMGCRRAGYYSYDVLDDGNVPSAREIHPELVQVEVGDVLPATPDADDGFEVLLVDEPRALVLGGLFDVDAGKQIRFASPRPERYWQVTWAFVLEPLDAGSTRLHVRGRAAFPETGRLHAAWIRPVHAFMQREQLRNLAKRAEGRMPRDTWRDVADGIVGALAMVADFATPFLRPIREHWGLDEATANRIYPGDELVPEPRWGWTHGVVIDAPADRVFPWVAQIGADRAGFYSYQWLENLAGCDLVNAETVHPEWQVRPGDSLSLHPDMPRMPIVHLEPGRCFVAFGAPDEGARSRGEPWASASWLFLVEPLEGGTSRFISRFRLACSGDLATRLAMGPYVTESIGFAMDRRMLLGVKERVERREREAVARS